MAGVNMPQGKKDGALDTAMKGLSVYANVASIRKDNAVADDAMSRRMKTIKTQDEDIPYSQGG